MRPAQTTTVSTARPFLRRRLARCALAMLAFAALAGAAATGETRDVGEQKEETVRVTLTDGSVLVGRIVAENDEKIELVLAGGATALVPRSGIVSIEEREAGAARATDEAALPPGLPPLGSRFTRSDPNYTRLFFAPTGRPLGKGEGQFADYYVLFPGFAAGLTENFSLLGGISAIPGLGLTEQLIYVAPRLAFQTSRRTSLSAGVLYGTIGSEADRAGAGIAFAVGTFGEPHASVSAGLGYGFLTFEGEFERADKPIVMVGGELQLNNSLALLSESWLILDVDPGSWPFTVGLRFFSDKISVDLGVILIGDALDEGFPVPWLSFSYRFERSKFASDDRKARRISARLPPRLR